MQVLITGGAGFFGRYMAEYLIGKADTERVCIYSRGEYAQAQMREQVNDERMRYFIGDVRDKERLRRAMEGVDVVIHAAALKRIEVGHYAPDEMVKTNIIGAMNVIDAAADAKVGKVVALSSDKAYQPVSPYGQSKALAESLFINANNVYGQRGPKYAAVRYGNVWMSRGSIVPKWQDMISRGATCVPVTDPSATRFFMWHWEAVNLVQHTIDTMNGGEIAIPDWLPAYSVGDLAEAMGVEMNIIGLPEYEKAHECMSDGLCSNSARRMTVDELREALKCDQTI